MDKILTISIASYNTEKTLAKAVESCMVPGSEAIEVIIVNDGSTDGTLALAENLREKWPASIRVINKPNGGYGSTINASLNAASGIYFRYLDGDDWFDRQSFESYIAMLRERDEDVVVTPYCQVYEDGTSSVLRDPFDGVLEGTYDFDSLPPGLPIACSIAYKTDVLKQSRFWMSEHCYYADTEFANLPMSNVQSLYISHLPIYQYRLGRPGQSVSAESIERHYEDIIRVRERVFEVLRASEGLPCLAYMQRSAAREVQIAYEFIFKARPSEERRRALVRLDQITREFPEVYDLSGSQSKKIRFLRFAKHSRWAYRLCCGYAGVKSGGRPF